MQNADARDPQQNRPAEATDGGMGGMHEGPQRVNDGSPDTSAADPSDGDVGRVGESPRQGQGGYGNDTGFTGGTVGATDGMRGGASDGDDADLGTEMDEDDARRRASGGQGMDGGMR